MLSKTSKGLVWYFHYLAVEADTDWLFLCPFFSFPFFFVNYKTKGKLKSEWRSISNDYCAPIVDPHFLWLKLFLENNCSRGCRQWLIRVGWHISLCQVSLIMEKFISLLQFNLLIFYFLKLNFINYFYFIYIRLL